MLPQGLPGRRVHFEEPDAVAPESRQMNQHFVALRLFQHDNVANIVMQNESAISRKVDFRDLNVGVLRADLILPGEGTTDVAISAFFVNGLDKVVRRVDAHGRCPCRQ